MQAFREGNERIAQRQLERVQKERLKKLEKSFEKVLTKGYRCDILFELSEKDSKLDLEN